MAKGLSQKDAGTSKGGVITIGAGGGSVILSTGTPPPESIVYQDAVSNGDTVTYDETITRLDGSSTTATVSLDTEAVPTVTGGTYGVYEITYSINGGANQTGYFRNTDDAAILTAIGVPSQDAEGYTDITAISLASDSRLLYVDPTLGADATQGPAGNNTDWYTYGSEPIGGWRTPTSINAFDTLAGAEAARRDGFADIILLKKGETFTITGSVVNYGGKGGRSATERTGMISYGSGARPIIEPAQSYDQIEIFRFYNTENWFVIGLDFYADWRNPSSGSFVGYGQTDSALGIRWLATSQDIDNVLVEDCRFRYLEDGMNCGSSAYSYNNFIWRRNIYEDIYSEHDTVGGNFCGNVNNFLLEQSLYHKGGWLIDRDATTYPDTNLTGTSNGGTGGNTLIDTGAAWKTTGQAMDLIMVTNNATGELGYITTTVSATQLTTSGITWTSGDNYTIHATRSRGQAIDFNHNTYFADCDNVIFRNNIFARGSSSSNKWTSNAPPPGVYADNIIVYDNVYVEDRVPHTWGGNPPFDAADGERFNNSRFLNNVVYNMGQDNTSDGIGFLWFYDQLDLYVGLNVITGFGSANGAWGGVLLGRGQTNTILAKNVIFNLGQASGTLGGVNRGSVVWDTAGAGQGISGSYDIQNEIQNPDVDAAIYGDIPSDGSVTVVDAKYFTPNNAAAFEINEVGVSFATFQTNMGANESGSTDTEITYQEERTIETYQTSLSATATVDAFITDAIAAYAPGSWDTNYEAKYIVEYFRAGYVD